MPDTPPANFDRATALGTAQHWAFHHAQDAQDHYDQAELTRVNADRTGIGGARADEPYALAERSRAMAETWARVATALAVPATADGQPATYDVHVALDPNATADELQRQLRDLKRHGNTGA